MIMDYLEDSLAEEMHRQGGRVCEPMAYLLAIQLVSEVSAVETHLLKSIDSSNPETSRSRLHPSRYQAGEHLIQAQELLVQEWNKGNCAE
jgi:hypothetical protein